jgi:thioredoxin 1
VRLEQNLALADALAKIVSPPNPTSLGQSDQHPLRIMVNELTDATFKKTLEAAKVPVLVDFSATWCQPCKALAPTIDKVAGDYTGKLDVYKIDIDKAQDTAASFGIQSVPTCIFFRNGKEVDRFLGNADLRTVKGHVDRVLAKTS